MQPRVYGPYENEEGRKLVILVWSDGRRKTTQYARWLLEQKLGRSLTDEETVDHIDGDFRNDAPDNLQVMSLADNIRKSCRKKEMWSFACAACGAQKTREARYVRRRQKLGIPMFCSLRCANKKRPGNGGTADTATSKAAA